VVKKSFSVTTVVYPGDGGYGTFTVIKANFYAYRFYLYDSLRPMVVALQEHLPKEYEIKRFDLPDMSRQEMDDLLKREILCRISFHDEPYPYTIPMEYYYFGNVIYFHFTTTGKKMELYNKNPNVTMEVDWHDDLLEDYKSVIIKGKLVHVENRTEREIVNVGMASAVHERAGIKAFLRLPLRNKGIDYLAASNIPLMLLKLEVKEITGKKAH
jgi:nitroimidazol reductase NimA-like FMN-containing flavoprotein (pyridoxamine 5'-phosphate oxidase superfamily)